MIFKQYFLECLAHASYLIADEGTRIAAIVDPQRDIDQYLADAQKQSLHIKHVLLTHFHADFISGHLELRERTGATIYLGARAQADYRFTPLKEGDSVRFGNVRLGILETPGHTPEGICILVYDLVKDAEKPEAVLTGDTLFIGDVGRPDLMVSVGVSAEEMAGMLYDSLHNKLLTVPDDTRVYPAHGAGSMCGKHLSTDTTSTIGIQRRYNYALQPMDKDEFIKLITADQLETPHYFEHAATLNRRERTTLEATLDRALKPLSLEETLRLRNAGAQLLDVRDPAEFAGGHYPGNVNIGLGGKFAVWAGTILDRVKPIVIIAQPGREAEAAMRLGRIGFDHVAGYLDGGMQALEKRPDLIRRTDRITAATLDEQLTWLNPPVPLVLDVRTEQERLEKRIEWSRHIPLSQLKERMEELPRHQPIVVHCASGYRSSIAASLLQQAGFTQVMDLIGGYEAWERADKESAFEEAKVRWATARSSGRRGYETQDRKGICLPQGRMRRGEDQKKGEGA